MKLSHGVDPRSLSWPVSEGWAASPPAVSPGGASPSPGGGGVVSGHMTPTRARGSAMYAAYLWFHTACMKKMGDGANPLCEGCLRAAKEAVAEPRAKRGRQM